MANSLMNAIRHALGFAEPEPSSSDEHKDVEDRLKRISERIAQRQRAIDIQVEVLRADRADAKRR